MILTLKAKQKYTKGIIIDMCAVGRGISLFGDYLVYYILLLTERQVKSY